MKRLHLAKPLFLLVLLSVIFCCVACSETVEPTIIDITPDFSTVDLSNAADTDFDLDLLNSPDRCKPYAAVYHSNSATTKEYAYIKDALSFLRRGNTFGSFAYVIDFYWYGYAATSDEKVTFTFNPTSGQSPFTITASRNEQTDIIIYQSAAYMQSAFYQPIKLSPGYEVKIFTRAQFADAVADGSLPETVVIYDTPANADYICKASFQITYT